MSERDILCIKRIKAELAFIDRALAGKSKTDFLTDDVVQYAISMSLINIGECANRLSDSFKNSYSSIEWFQCPQTAFKKLRIF